MQPQSSNNKSTKVRGGCLGKLFSLLAVVVVFGALGWLGAKFWLYKVDNGKIDEPHGVSSPDNSPGDQNWERKSKNLRLRSQLGIDHSFFNDLVNQLFWQEYPEQEGKPLTKNDQKVLARWDELAEFTLDKLGNLSKQARQNLGKYSQQDYTSFVQQANQLHLSSKALNDLAEGQFFLLFPKQQIETLSDKPLEQVWLAVVFDLLTEMQGGINYEKISLTTDNAPSEFSNTLQPGHGQAYVTRLSANDSLSINLDAPPNLLFSIYSPSGQANLLQDSRERNWQGTLPEDGYYEITLVSRSETPLNYRLTITIVPSSP